MVEIIDLNKENFSDKEYNIEDIGNKTQIEKTDENVIESIKEFNWLHTIVVDKLDTDKVCFNCKVDLLENKDIVDNKMYLVRLSNENSPKGSVVIVSICKKCWDEYNKDNKDEIKTKTKKNKNE